MSKSYIAGSRPIQDGCEHRTRLSHKRKIACQRLNMAKARIEARTRNHDAKAVRSHNSQKMRSSHIQHSFLQPLAFLASAFAQSGGDDHSGFGPESTQLGDQPGNRIRRRGNHSKVWWFGQADNVRIAQDSLNSLIFRIDRKDFTFESSA